MAILEEIRRLSREQQRRNERSVVSLIRRFSRVLGLRFSRVVRDLSGDPSLSPDDLRILAELRDVSRDPAILALLRDVERVYGVELIDVREALRVTVSPEFDFDESDFDAAEKIIQGELTRTVAKLNNHMADASSVLASQIVSQVPVDLSQVVEDATPRVLRQIQTELDTGSMAFNRVMQFKKANDLGLSKFYYIGPDDQVTRPFCRDVLDRFPPIYTKKEVEAMNNGQGLDVFAYGGGYNCRHHWRAISDEFADEVL